MALILCPECRKEISDHASSCPNCGTPLGNKKFCIFCGEQIDRNCVICPKCGKQVENIATTTPNITVNNSSNASAIASAVVASAAPGNQKNKWVSFFLCLFFGFLGVHKFYEGKIGLGILYIFTVGLFGFGWLIDLIIILTKPNPYYI